MTPTTFLARKSYERLNDLMRGRYDAWLAEHPDAGHDEAMSHAWNPSQEVRAIGLEREATDLAATHDFYGNRECRGWPIVDLGEVRQRLRDGRSTYACPKLA